MAAGSLRRALVGSSGDSFGQGRNLAEDSIAAADTVNCSTIDFIMEGRMSHHCKARYIHTNHIGPVDCSCSD